jgi:hypothetical protein
MLETIRFVARPTTFRELLALVRSEAPQIAALE